MARVRQKARSRCDREWAWFSRKSNCANKAVTSREMRLFARECLRWSDQAADASQRDLVLRVATSWMNTAAAIERRIGHGDGSALPDLRTKLD
jgi:hypothetical protein